MRASSSGRAGVSFLTQGADRDCGDITLVDRGGESVRVGPAHYARGTLPYFGNCFAATRATCS